jgi:hypothetical protein
MGIQYPVRDRLEYGEGHYWGTGSTVNLTSAARIVTNLIHALQGGHDTRCRINSVHSAVIRGALFGAPSAAIFPENRRDDSC